MNRSQLQLFVRVFSAYALIGGLLSLMGWVLDHPRLISWDGSGITIKANAALCTIFAALALLAVTLQPHKFIVRTLALVPLLIGCATLTEHLTGVDLGIDTFFFEEPVGEAATTAPGRMGPPGSISFTLLGLSLILSTMGSSARRWAARLGLVVLAVVSLSLIGYLYGVGQLFAIARFSGISFQTVTMIAALAVGLLIAIPDHGITSMLGRMDAGGLAMRRMILPIVLLPILIGWFRIAGESAELFDSRFGAAARTLTEIAILLALLCWAARGISQADQSLRAAAQALQISQERYQRLVQIVPVGVYTCEAPSGVITFFNDHAAWLWGRTPDPGDCDERFCGSFKLRRPDGSPLPHASTPMAIALREGKEYRNEEVVIERPDGSCVTVLVNIDPIFDAQGRVAGAINAFHDISERKQAEQDAEAQAERLNILWAAAGVLLTAEDPDSMLQGIFQEIRDHLDVDCYFNFMLASDGAGLRLVSCAGIPDEEAAKIHRLELGQAVCGLVAVEHKPIVESFIQQSDHPRVQLVKKYGIRSYACNPLIVGNRLLGTLSFASRMRNAFTPGEVEFMEIICRYVTAAYERLSLIGDLRAADRRKNEFLATLAHELRNPLAPIRNAFNIVKVAPHFSGEAAELTQVIERQLNQLVRLIDDLLDVSRISRGKIELRKKHVDLAGVVHHALETARPLAQSHNHQILVDLPSEPISLEGDAVRLSQVFSNLLNNACKFTPPGGTIEVSGRRENDQVVVSVTDNGIGVPADKLADIFEIFSQVDSSPNRLHGGLGIGLSLAKTLVQMHGGTIEAYSEGLGRGTGFTVRLPILHVAAATEPGSGSNGKILTGGAKPKRRVLVVDDNVDAARTLAMLIQMDGHEARVAHDGREAIAHAAQYQPEVILLDIGLPHTSGFEVCRTIRSQPWGSRIQMIALTGWGQEEDRRRSAEAGFDRHLVKPIDPELISNILSDV